ncbi:unnamed protein product [Parajaminaea phylloscopi]
MVSTSSRGPSAEQPVWASARVAQRKAQQDTVSRHGSSASVWAAPSAKEPPQGQLNTRASSWAPSRDAQSEPQASASTSASTSIPAFTSTSKPASGPIGNTVTRSSPTENAALQPRASHSGLRRRDDARSLGAAIDPMSLIASPSRGIHGAENAALGSAAEQDLTQEATQNRYREYLAKRIREHCKRHALPFAAYVPSILPASASDSVDDEARSAKAGLEEILLQGRKLREGIMASQRRDAAAIEAYHLVLLLAITTLNRAQVSATMHRIVFDLYPAVPLTPSRAPASVTSDFATLPDARASQLDLFVDSRETREHTASLLLLSHTCLSDTARSSAIEDNFPRLKWKVLDSVGSGQHPELISPHIRFAEAVHVALDRCDVLAFRRLLLGQFRHKGSGELLPKPTVWQRMLLSQAVPRLRRSSWAHLKKVYLTVPLPSHTRADDWLARMLVLDGKVAPDATTPRSHTTKPVDTPDDWQDGDAPSSAFLLQRLAAFFAAQALPEAPQSPGAAGSNAGTQAPAPLHSCLAKWAGRIATNTSSGICTIKIK